MALEDYYERLRDIVGTGTRQGDFERIRSQRARDRRDFIQTLKNKQARDIEFAVTIPKQMYQQQSINAPVARRGAPGGSGIDLLESLKGVKLGYPLKGDLRMTSDFGPRTHPVHGRHSNHTGIDWAAKSGTPIYAPGDAVVRSTDWNKIYGNRTILDLGGGLSVMLGHQSGWTVKPGQQVNAGELVGYVGSTGLSTGPHLHFETWVNNKPVNPLSWFL